MKKVLYETNDYFVTAPEGEKHGFWVWKTGVTHSVRCAEISWCGDVGLEKAVRECDKRQALAGKRL